MTVTVDLSQVIGALVVMAGALSFLFVLRNRIGVNRREIASVRREAIGALKNHEDLCSERYAHIAQQMADGTKKMDRIDEKLDRLIERHMGGVA